MTTISAPEVGASLSDWQATLSAWAEAYYSRREKKDAFLLAHLMEEAAEVWKEWREGNIEGHLSVVSKHGTTFEKPEGVGSEIADVIGMALIVAHFMDLDAEFEMGAKFDYLLARLEAKLAKKNKKGKQ